MIKPESRYRVVESFAEAWRAIGQPDTDGLFLVVSTFSYWAQFDSMLGIPVIVSGVVFDREPAIAGRHDERPDAPEIHRRFWREACLYELREEDWTDGEGDANG